MTETQKRNKRNRGAGYRHEYNLTDGLRRRGFDTERIRNSGTKDEGDVVVRRNNYHHLIEAKNTARLDATGFLRQAKVEGGHYSTRRGLEAGSVLPVAIWKRPGRNSMESVVLMEMDTYLELVKLAGAR